MNKDFVRQINFCYKHEFENDGFITNNSILLDDVDNDGDKEFCCCNLNGELKIYKYLNKNESYYCSDLGTVIFLKY
jgi:hypothetical protein